MLKLGRHKGQSIIIDGKVLITLENIYTYIVKINYGDLTKFIILPYGIPVLIMPDIHLVRLEKNGTTVILGIMAPRHIEVDRLEIWEKKQAEKSSSLGPSLSA